MTRDMDEREEVVFFIMIRQTQQSTKSRSSAASDVYKETEQQGANDCRHTERNNYDLCWVHGSLAT